MDRSLKSIKESDLIFLVLNLTEPFNNNIEELLEDSSKMLDRFCFIFNKSDLVPKGRQSSFLNKRVKDILKSIKLKTVDQFNGVGDVYKEKEFFIKKRCFVVSATELTGFTHLLNFLKNFSGQRWVEDSAIITQARHFELLKTACERLSMAIKLLRKKMSPEFVVFELQDSLLSIKQLLGKQYDDEVMDRVF